jgi:hypothetical protein
MDDMTNVWRDNVMRTYLYVGQSRNLGERLSPLTLATHNMWGRLFLAAVNCHPTTVTGELEVWQTDDRRKHFLDVLEGTLAKQLDPLYGVEHPAGSALHSSIGDPTSFFSFVMVPKATDDRQRVLLRQGLQRANELLPLRGVAGVYAFSLLAKSKATPTIRAAMDSWRGPGIY